MKTLKLIFLSFFTLSIQASETVPVIEMNEVNYELLKSYISGAEGSETIEDKKERENIEQLISQAPSISLVERAIENHREKISKAINEEEISSSAPQVIYRGINLESKEFEVVLINENDHEQILRGAFVKPPESKGWRIKVFQGDYVDTTLNKIVRMQLADGHHGNTKVEGIEVGKVVLENFKGWPLDFVVALGFAHHDDQEFQGEYQSYTIQLKAEWKKFPWNRFVRTKIEFGEGLNYADKVPYFEGLHVRKKNDGRDSKLLNYLGVGIAFNLGDIFRVDKLKNCYIGAYAFHRSGIFGAIGPFNNVNGGSNYQTTSIECYQ